jgi:hypothetical protein
MLGVIFIGACGTLEQKATVVPSSFADDANYLAEMTCVKTGWTWSRNHRCQNDSII